MIKKDSICAMTIWLLLCSLAAAFLKKGSGAGEGSGAQV